MFRQFALVHPELSRHPCLQDELQLLQKPLPFGFSFKPYAKKMIDVNSWSNYSYRKSGDERKLRHA
jgi:hypothetical protein